MKRFFRYRYNPDNIKVSVIRDYNKAFEVFLKGGIDMFGLAKTEFWYDKLPIITSWFKMAIFQR